MRGLAISGGGSKGAEGHGIACALSLYNDWDCFSGTSVGSCICSTAALVGFDFEPARRLFQGHGVEDLWTIHPFPDGVIGKLSNWLKAWRKSGHAIGDFSGLRSVIVHTYAAAYGQKLYDKPCWVSCVSQFGELHNIPIHEIDIEQRVRAIYASSSPPIISAGEIVGGQLMFDGGIKQHVPIIPLIKAGCDIIDVIVHESSVPRKEVSSVADAAALTLSTLMGDVAESDIEIAKLAAAAKCVASKPVEINVYTATYPIKNSFVFDPEEMKKAWIFGFNSIEVRKKLIVTPNPA